MSSVEQPVDAQLIEQTDGRSKRWLPRSPNCRNRTWRRRISIVNSSSRRVRMLAAIGGAVWTTNEDGQLALQYQINLQQTQLEDRRRRETEATRQAPLQGIGRRSGIARAAAVRLRGRRRSRQSDRLPPGPRPLEDRPGNGRHRRDLPAQRCGAERSARLSAIPFADVRSGDRLHQEPPVAAFFRPPSALGSARRFHPHGPLFARPHPDSLHDLQRRPATDRMRSRQRGHSPWKPVHH